MMDSRVTFHPPGADHHARWMSKAIYSLKMFMFRNQFELTDDERNGLRNVCIFIMRHYLENWFRCPIAAEAPYQDFNFLKGILQDKTIDPKLSQKIIKKFSNHLSYLADESLGLAFFDSTIPSEIKQAMVERLHLGDDGEDDEEDEFVHQDAHKVLATVEEIKRSYLTKNFSDFVTKNSLNFFFRFRIPTDFLWKPVKKWESLDSYQEGLIIIKQLKVTNDTAERTVYLMSQFVGILTKNDKDYQELVTVVDEYNHEYPTSLKKDLM